MLKIVDEPEGATPLTPDDMQGLRYQHLETRAQLNELEASNILKGQMWANKLKAPTLETIFSRDFITQLHISFLVKFGNGLVFLDLES